ncbi:glycoside hydrolase family 3 C-terminal domain-containing protein [Microlunatus parietis]|uniref:Beta-glucosidase n=1 Tax=Microlunatus parietis TaxID=682979 RepID=A0A7Y9I5H4_9ACTN|nr:glycoside hydrolase family 3 C-terminal domain-containing protein [Microlunatus parietis]NYE70572.1 beta-glucosidase [Microlunatus parietis]
MAGPELVRELTLREKASLTSGETAWTTKSVREIGSVVVSDGPHGLRRPAEGADEFGLSGSLPATCFPPAVALGSSWDVDLVRRVGRALGVEARAAGVGVVLGPGINLKRSPLCGRNFEYFSEDPLITGVLGSAMVAGIQSQGVGASLKHFAANNAEHDRFRSSSEIDPRTLRELYLRAFHRIVTEQQPWTVMAAYNKINGVYATEHPWLLTALLRGEWGFTGLVVSDWGAVDDPVSAIGAGLDLIMPSTGGRSDAVIIDAVERGALAEAAVDRAAGRVAELAERVKAGAAGQAPHFDRNRHHTLAREAAGKSIVLLRNVDDILPLDPAGSESIAVIGELAREPRYQGAGSSMINPTRLDRALGEIVGYAGQDRVSFAPGYRIGPGTDGDLVSLRDEATALAEQSDVVIIFLGLPAEEESEGFDRQHLELPADQTTLLDAVLAVNSRVIVVLSNGGVVRVSGWQHLVPGLIEGWLLGQAGGAALADVLFGAVNPSGRLAETIPFKLSDTPAYLDFPGQFGKINYSEGIFVGYRYFDARDLPVSFPFGHGLSYTTFEYSGASAQQNGDGLRLRVRITNTGQRSGREVVQVYAGLPGSRVSRPPRQLIGFTIVELAAGESRQVELIIPRSELAYYHPIQSRWLVEGGRYRIEVGSSSRDIRGMIMVEVSGEEEVNRLTPSSSLAEVMAVPAARAALQKLLAHHPLAAMIEDPATLAMIGSMPIRRLASFPGAEISDGQLTDLLSRLPGRS